jgi:transcriptional regulator with XRE-family HTH domain
MNKMPKKNELGDLLRQWRGLRGRSQLDISVDTGISQRQISFIESGRSVPSRSTLMGIAQALEIPLRERNALLLAAGYAPLYSDAVWNSDEMKSISKALARMIAQHEPYPAIVMDRYWNVLLTNDAAPRFFNCFIDMSERPSPRNMLHPSYSMGTHSLTPCAAPIGSALLASSCSRIRELLCSRRLMLLLSGWSKSYGGG